VGLIYLILVGLFGWKITAGLRLQMYSPQHKASTASIVLFELPAAWCGGYVVTTTSSWLVLQAIALVSNCKPALDVVAWMTVIGLLLACLLTPANQPETKTKAARREYTGVGALILSILGVSAILTFGSIYSGDHLIAASPNMFPDLYAHVALIRSFSFGYNFPTEYPFYIGEGMKYHFLFYFGSGVLEKLGLPLTWALNVPSFLSVASMLSLAAFLAWRASGLFAAACLAPIFCLFRSSLSWIDFLKSEIRSYQKADAEIVEPFIFGTTPFERWGIFTPNAHLNQHHLVMGLAIMLLCFVFCALSPPTQQSRLNKEWRNFVLAGLFLGLSIYWNGATFLASAFGLIPALFSKNHSRRAAIILGTAVCVGAAEVALVNQGGSSALPHRIGLRFGFLAGSTHLSEVMIYCAWIFGVQPLVAFFAARRGVECSILVWSMGLMPILAVFFLQLTPEIVQGHKFINAGTLVWASLAAGLTASLMTAQLARRRVVGMLLAVLMTLTGVLDAGMLLNFGSQKRHFSLNEKIIQWIDGHTPADSVFLSAVRGDQASLVAGRRTFLGPCGLVSGVGYAYDVRLKWMNKLTLMSATEQVQALQDVGVGFISTEGHAESDMTPDEMCAARPDLGSVFGNPLLKPVFFDPGTGSVILEVPSHG